MHRRHAALRLLTVLLGICLPAAAAPTQAPRPALTVFVSVDQLAKWVFEDAFPHFVPRRGFRRLVDFGVYFDHCAYRHGCTETGPGHATIGTGATAAVHGIVANQWLDPATGKGVYCATSPDASPVGGGAAGRGPGTLLVPTLGDALKEQVPGSQVVSISLKDRAAILMGGARSDIALWFDPASGRFVTSTAYARMRPAWLDRFEGAFPMERFFGQEWDAIGEPAAYAGLVDDRPFEGADPNGCRTLPERIDGGLAAPGPRYYGQVYTSPFGNTALVDLARAAIAAYHLGADDVPDLLCVGFSSTDAIGHRNGPLSVEVRDTLLRLDQQLEDLLRTLDAHVGHGRYAVFLTADHGVGPAPESDAAREHHGGRAPRYALRVRSAAERALRGAYGAPPDGHERWVRGLAGPWLYLDRAALDARHIDRAEAAAEAAAALGEIDSVHAAIPTIGDAEGADPELAAILADTAHEGRSGDVWVVIEPYWLGYPTPTASHGSPWPYDREVPLLAYGPGLRKGARVSTPVTPGTAVVLAAALWGIEPPSGARDPLPSAALRTP